MGRFPLNKQSFIMGCPCGFPRVQEGAGTARPEAASARNPSMAARALEKLRRRRSIAFAAVDALGAARIA